MNPSYQRRRTASLTFLLAMAVLLAGCASLPGRLEPPEVTLAGLELRESTLFEQNYHVKLRVANPNNKPLTITGLRFELILNGKPFANGSAAETITVPRLGNGVLKAQATTGLGGILRQLMSLQNGAPAALTYRLTGKLYLKGRPMGVAFDRNGEFELPAGGTGASR